MASSTSSQPEMTFFPPIDSKKLPIFSPVPLTLEPLFSIQCTVAQPRSVGNTGAGDRWIIPFTGLEMQALSSKLVDNNPDRSPFARAKGTTDVAVDCLVFDANKVSRLDARYIFQLQSGHLLYIQSHGTRFMYDVEKKVDGKDSAADATQPPSFCNSPVELNPSTYYFRLQLTLESDDPHPLIQRACRSLVIGSAVRSPNAVTYEAYLVL